ncbi:PepSY-associated TM helix domain-containing protein [Marinospirillum sp. MEB164]|uniref:PepSY-associated TM helix domain-containing protein n=1 Tax=Marinospirillum alkalitolerans TaxID=3123374 RepID=A0ABW8PWL3_9GAMM
MARLNLSKSQRWVRPLHTYSSMLMLFILLFFTITGITLNNRHWLPQPAPPQEMELPLPEIWHNQLTLQADKTRLSADLWRWLRQQEGLPDGEVSVDWPADEPLLSLDIKRPGGYTLVEVDLEEAQIWYEHHRLGWWAVLNDLHMGRNSGQLWSWFIDLSALVMLLFTLTGLWLILFNPKRRRPSLVLSGLGTLVMVGLYVWFLV